MKRMILGLTLALSTLLALPATAADFVIDDQHTFIQFRIKHLGFSWLYGRFDDVEGTFSYDADKPGTSKVSVVVKTASIDTDHAERDKHLRSEDFFDVERFPEARFVSTAYREHGKDKATLEGRLTIHGVTKPVSLDVQSIGEGPDPWDGYRHGFLATTTVTLADFGMDYDLGPASRTAELILSIEGIRQ